MPIVIPQRLQIVREARGLTLNKLSQKAKISDRNLHRIEKSRKSEHTVNDNTFDSLVNALKVDADVLSGRKDLPEEIINQTNRNETRLKSLQINTPESFETRLVKIEDEYVIVEFNSLNPTGKIIARGIKDENAGLMLSEVAELKKRFTELYRLVIDPRPIEESFEDFVDDYRPGFTGNLDDVWDEYIDELHNLTEPYRIVADKHIRNSGENLISDEIGQKD